MIVVVDSDGFGASDAVGQLLASKNKQSKTFKKTTDNTQKPPCLVKSMAGIPWLSNVDPVTRHPL